MCSFIFYGSSPYLCVCVPSYRSLSGREAAYTIHGYEVKIHASEASSGTGQLPSGSSKVRGKGERGRGRERGGGGEGENEREREGERGVEEHKL